MPENDVLEPLRNHKTPSYDVVRLIHRPFSAPHGTSVGVYNDRESIAAIAVNDVIPDRTLAYFEGKHMVHNAVQDFKKSTLSASDETSSGRVITEKLSHPTSNATIWNVPTRGVIYTTVRGGVRWSNLADRDEKARPTGKSQGQGAMQNAKAMASYESAEEFRNSPESYKGFSRKLGEDLEQNFLR
nr:hypothetical protein Iba_chr04bCG16020 [Ipomoea batatas]